MEWFIALFIHNNFIRSSVGDFLVVFLIYCWIRTFFKFSVVNSAIVVLLYANLTEISQYFGLIYKLNWEHSFLAKIVLGKSFSWGDILIYTIAFGFILLAENKNRRTLLR